MQMLESIYTLKRDSKHVTCNNLQSIIMINYHVVSVVSTCIVLVFQSKLKPHDAHACYTFTYSILALMQ